MSNDYFEEQFIEETFQEEIMGKNTSRFFLTDYFSKMKQMKKDHKWIQENLKKLKLHKRMQKYQKVSLINSSADILKDAKRVLDI